MLHNDHSLLFTQYLELIAIGNTNTDAWPFHSRIFAQPQSYKFVIVQTVYYMVCIVIGNHISSPSAINFISFI